MNRLLLALILVSAVAHAQSRRQIDRVEFPGSVTFSDDRLLGLLRTQETPSSFWQWMYVNIGETFGEPPQYYDPIAVDADVLTLSRFLENQGFYKSRVLSEIVPSDDRVIVKFGIEEGARAFVDSVTIRGLEGLPESLINEILETPLIESGDPFVYESAEAEFRRIITAFSNDGYVGVQSPRKSAIGNADSTGYWILFEFSPGILHEFGDITVEHDSLSEEQIDDDVIRRHLDFRPGERYSEAKKAESERLLNRLGVFDASRVEIMGREDAGDRVRVPMRVSVRTRSFQELTPEIGISGENGGTNALVGLGYSHRNFMGGARNFSALFRYSLRSVALDRIGGIFGASGLKDSTLVARSEVSFKLLQPYLFTNKISLTSSLSWILDKQKTFYVPIFRGNVGILSQPSILNRFLVDLNLEWIDPTSVTTSQDTVLLGRFEPQFNSILTLTYQQDRRNDIFNPSSGSVYTIVAEEAGILPSFFRSIGGRPLPFSQYVKLVLIGQYYVDPGPPGGVVWAFRALTGAAQLYKPSADVPLTRRFYAGGSGSIRGWKARELGSLAVPDQGGKAITEVSVEARFSPFRSAEDFLFLDPRKISFAFFADAGNVWEERRVMRVDEVAIAAGFSFRYNTVAGPVRIDFGLKVYDPGVIDPERRWITSKKFWSETFAGGVIHLGIGHPF